MTTEQLAQIRMSANDEFKARYPRYLRRGAYVALFIILLLFLFSPKYVPSPYRLRTSTFEVVDMPDAVELPPPPEDVPKPQAPIEAAPDDEVGEDVDVAESLFEDFESVPLPSDLGAGDSGDVFVASQEKPKLIKFVPPDYPEMARASQLEGTVLIKVLVGPDGSVLQAVVLQSVHPMLDAAAREAALKCKFEPGKQRNIPVKAWMAIPFRFRLHS
jgi:protein TonB